MALLKKAIRGLVILLGVGLFIVYGNWIEQTWPNSTLSETVFREIYLKLLFLVLITAAYETFFKEPFSRSRLREIAANVFAVFVYVSLFSLGLWLMARFYETVLVSQPLTVRVTVSILAGIPLFFFCVFGALWLGHRIEASVDATKKPRQTVRLLVPKSCEIAALQGTQKSPLHAPHAQIWFGFFCVTIALICLVVAIVTWNAQNDLALGSAVTGAFFGCGSLAFWTQKPVSYNASGIHFKGRHFSWSEIEEVEETRLENIFGGDEVCVWEFKGAGKTAFQLSMNEFTAAQRAKFEALFEAR